MDHTRHSDFYCVRKTEKWRNLDGRHSDGGSQEKRERRNMSRPVDTSKRLGMILNLIYVFRRRRIFMFTIKVVKTNDLSGSKSRRTLKNNGSRLRS